VGVIESNRCPRIRFDTANINKAWLITAKHTQC
jgi:hypothetical protein